MSAKVAQQQLRRGNQVDVIIKLSLTFSKTGTCCLKSRLFLKSNPRMMNGIVGRVLLHDLVNGNVKKVCDGGDQPADLITAMR